MGVWTQGLVKGEVKLLKAPHQTLQSRQVALYELFIRNIREAHHVGDEEHYFIFESLEVLCVEFITTFKFVERSGNHREDQGLPLYDYVPTLSISAGDVAE